MKKTALIIVLLLLSLSVLKSQQIYLNTGKILSHFNFVNADGEELTNLFSSSHSSMEFGYRVPFLSESLVLNIGVSYKNYGAIGSGDLVNNYFEWSCTYLGSLLGFDLRLFQIGELGIFAKTVVSSEFMLQGTQTLNNRVINLVGEEDFDSPMFFYGGGMGLEWKISEKFSATIQYLYGNGKSFKKNPETLNIITHNISFGIVIDILKKPKERIDTPKNEDSK